MRASLVSLGIVGLSASLAIAQTATFTPLGVPPGHSRSVVFDISADGSTVVGTARLPSSPFRRGFVWNDGQLQLLATGPDGPGSNGEGVSRVSADGLVIIGTDSQGRGIRWINGAVELADPPSGNWAGTGPSAISESGSIIYPPSYIYEGGAWTSLQFLTTVFDCSDDGATALGIMPTQNGPAFWAIRLADGSVLVPPVPAAPPGTSAGRLSADGQVFVGDLGGTAMRWRRGESEYEYFDFTPALGWMTHVASISDDAQIVVGSASGGISPEGLFGLNGPVSGGSPAMIWHADRGGRSIANVLRQLGVDTSGWQLLGAAGCSRDGLTIAGTGLNPQGMVEGWRVTLPGIPASPDFDNSRLVDVADIFAFLTAWFSGDGLADFNLDGQIDVPDIFHFLQFWFGQSL